MAQIKTIEYLIKFGVISQKAVSKLNEISAVTNATVAKMGAGAKNLGTTLTKVQTGTGRTSKTFYDFKTQIQDTNGIIEQTVLRFRSTRNGLVAVDSATKKTTTGMHDLAAGTHKAAGGFLQLASRSAMVVPIWMLIRAIWQGIFGTIGGVAKAHIELEKAMARVATVTKGNAEDLKELKGDVIAYSAGATKGFGDIAKAMYALGSAGLSVTEQMSGFKSIMDLSIGTLGDTEQIAKLVAGAYNVFGNSLEGAYTNSAKFKKISDTLAYTYATQQVELSEIANAMTYVASVGKLVNISFEDIVTTIGVLNTGMLKGTKSGTALMNAFVQLATNTDKLSTLGVAFDPSKPLDFMDIMTQLNGIYGQQAMSLNSLRDIMDVFGKRGGRAAAQLISDFDRWKKAIKDTKAEFKDYAGYMKRTMEDTLPGAWSKFWNAFKASWVSKVDTGFAKDTLSKVTAANQAAAILNQKKGLVPQELIDKRKLAYGIMNALPQPRRGFAQEQANAEIINWNEQNQGLAEIQKKSNELLKAEKFSASGIITFQEEINSLAKLSYENKVDESVIDKKIVALMERKFRNLKAGTKEYDAHLKVFQDEVKVKAEVLQIEEQIGNAQRKKIRDIDQAGKYNVMAAKGLEEELVIREKMGDKLEYVNTLLSKHENTSLRQISLDNIILGNFKKWEEALIHVGGAAEDLYEIRKLNYELQVKEIEKVTEYGDKLKEVFGGGLTGFLSGKSDFNSIFSGLGGALTEGTAGALSEGLTEGLFDSMGIDKMFGGLASTLNSAGKGIVGKLKLGFDYGAKITEQAIRNGFNKGTGAKGSVYAGSFGAGGIGGFTLPGFGEGGFMNTPMGNAPYSEYMGSKSGTSYPGGYAPKGYKDPTKVGLSGGQVAGSALMGYSSYQSAQAGGMDQGMSVGAGVATTVGSLGLMAGMSGMYAVGGALAMLGPIGWIASAALFVVGALMSSGVFGGQKKSVETSTQESTRAITSKIDISNKELAWVNRNLVALKQELTYIMEQSFYFRERSPEEAFAIGSQR